MTTPLLPILKPPTIDFDKVIKNPNKHIHFNNIVSIEAIAEECITFHLPLEIQAHTIEDRDLFFHVRPALPGRKAHLKNIVLLAPSDPLPVINQEKEITRVISDKAQEQIHTKFRPSEIEIEFEPTFVYNVPEYNEIYYYRDRYTLPLRSRIPLIEQLYASYCLLKRKKQVDFQRKSVDFLKQIDKAIFTYECELKRLGMIDPKSETALNDIPRRLPELEVYRFFYYVPQTYWTPLNILQRIYACKNLINVTFDREQRINLLNLKEGYEKALSERGIPNDKVGVQLIQIAKVETDCIFLLDTNLKDVALEELEEWQAYFANAISTRPHLQHVLDLIERLILLSPQPCEPAPGAVEAFSAESSELLSFPPPPASQ